MMWRFCCVLAVFVLGAACPAAGGEAGPGVTTSSVNVVPLPRAPARKGRPAADDQWRTYLHTKEGLTKEGVLDADGNVNSGASSLGLYSRVRLATEQLTEYGPSFGMLSVEATPETATRLHVKIYPTGEKRWEVPESIVPRPKPEADLKKGNLIYEFSTDHQQHNGKGADALALTVTRKSNGSPMFDSTGYRLIFKDQYIELTTKLQKNADIMGLGQVVLPTKSVILPRDGTPITLWARDQPGALAEPYANLYGSHPFYMQVNKDGFAHGVLFLNSNGMDVILNETSLTYKALGGLVDLYIFAGPYPEDVISQYQEVIGTPMMPPYWSLGNHQAKWGYANYKVVEQVLANFSAAGVPLEGIWLDIDYMNNRFQTLTLDSERFPAGRMRALVDRLHAAGQKWVPLQDAGIAKMPGYKAYDDGAKDGIWIKNYKGQPYLGQVWPGEAYWPDYLSHPKATSWLTEQIKAFYKQAPFDGLWMDMSEAANFCTGVSCKADATSKRAMQSLTSKTPAGFNFTDFVQARSTCQLKCELAPAANKLANPPYAIHNFDITTKKRGQKLDRDIISVTAKHYDGTSEYDAHNLYGVAMAMAHYKAYTAATGKRPFNIIRSTFPGSGRYAGQWTGDNSATWQALADSVASTLVPSMWGISMVGPDICGFADTSLAPADSTGSEGEFSNKDGDSEMLDDAGYEELCNRWTSAGAFYPFSRNHASYFGRSHEPYRWPAVAAAAKKAFGLRYRLLTYLYSSLYLAHSRGGTFARPLFFIEPSDIVARNVNSQWMLGEALMVSPVLTRNTTSIFTHFPKGNWYSAWDYSKTEALPKGRMLRLDVPVGDIPVFFRGGAIVPMQRYANVTRDVRYSPVTLLVTLPAVLSVAPKGKTSEPEIKAPAAAQPKAPAAGQAKPGAGKATPPAEAKPVPRQAKPAAPTKAPPPAQIKPTKPVPGQALHRGGQPAPAAGHAKPNRVAAPTNAPAHSQPRNSNYKPGNFGGAHPAIFPAKPAAGGQAKLVSGPAKPAAGGQAKPHGAQQKPQSTHTKPTGDDLPWPLSSDGPIKSDAAQGKPNGGQNRPAGGHNGPNGGAGRLHGGAGQPGHHQGQAAARHNQLNGGRPTGAAARPFNGQAASRNNHQRRAESEKADRLLAGLAPYAREEVCAAAHASNGGKLVSCGMLYSDADTVELKPSTSVQVWYTAVTAADTRSGTITSTVAANGGAAKDKLRIESINVLGVEPPAATSGSKVRVTVNGKPVPKAEYDASSGVLKIRGLDVTVGAPLDLRWGV